MPSIAGNQEASSTFSFECVEDVDVVEFCPFDSAAGLIAYGGEERVSVGVCVFQEEAQDSHLPVLQFQHITDFHHGTSVHSLAWSPKTNIQHLPYSFQWVIHFRNKLFYYYSGMLIFQTSKENENWFWKLKFEKSGVKLQKREISFG